MPDDDIEKRVTKLEMNFDEYMAIFYKWLDEQRKEMKEGRAEFKEFRADMKEMRKEHEERMRKLEDTQSLIARLLLAMGEKLDDHNDRLSAAGI